ncbi:unnamed protein product [Leptidea sinapis]|uniref:FAD dependent oxidoreductase domain-containing protein n=1 Tax=Leptidea sinapis TaxID=189913 RepID=A0A5E4PTX8_9NEOP|nr:unnamed protein product [Leptidea sinapis]
MAVKYMKNAPYLTFIIATIYLAIKKLRVCTLIKGAWGPRVARFAGIPALPLVPFKHAYVVSEGIPEIRNAPNLRDHDVNLYIKIQGDAASLCPTLANIGVKSTVCGPESFTPDHKPLLGEDPNLFGLYHNCGYNSSGMMFSAGCGIQLAEWIIKGRPNYNMFTFDIRRFTPSQMSRAHWAREASFESYVKNYSIVFPNDEPLAGRDTSHDALHQELVEDGAIMQVQQYDWGGAHDYPRNQDTKYEDILKGEYTFGFSKHFDIIKKEALAARNSAALFNLSYYGKFYLTGPDAQRTADLAFTANLSKRTDGWSRS